MAFCRGFSVSVAFHAVSNLALAGTVLLPGTCLVEFVGANFADSGGASSHSRFRQAVMTKSKLIIEDNPLY